MPKLDEKVIYLRIDNELYDKVWRASRQWRAKRGNNINGMLTELLQKTYLDYDATKLLSIEQEVLKAVDSKTDHKKDKPYIFHWCELMPDVSNEDVELAIAKLQAKGILRYNYEAQEFRRTG